jgi:hypothetical protein
MRLLFHSIESKRLITAYNNSSGREGRDVWVRVDVVYKPYTLGFRVRVISYS